MKKIHIISNTEEYSTYLNFGRKPVCPGIEVYRYEELTESTTFRWQTGMIKTLFFQLSFNESFQGDIVKDGSKVETEDAFIGFISPLHEFLIMGHPKSWYGYTILFSLDFAEFSLWNNQSRKDFPFLFDESVPAFILSDIHQRNYYRKLFHQIYVLYNSHSKYTCELLRKELYKLLMEIRDDFPAQREPAEPDNQQKTSAMQFFKLVNENFQKYHQTGFYHEMLHITQDQLYYSVKKYWGKTPLEIIHEKLLHEAQILMEHTRLSITEIAHQLHFEEVSHFSRFFKNQTGLSPSEYLLRREGY